MSYVLLVLMEMIFLQTIAVDRLHYLLEQSREPDGHPLQFGVERVLEQVVVQISNQMYEALLLQAIQRIICRVEIRYQDAMEPGQRILRCIPVSCRGIGIDDGLRIGECPHVASPTTSFYHRLGLIGVDQLSASETGDEGLVGWPVAICYSLQEIGQ